MPAPLPFDIVYEDEDLLVINKPADMPIHPSFQNHGNTLADALTWHYQQQEKSLSTAASTGWTVTPPDFSLSPNTSSPLRSFTDMVRRREIHREYLAIVEGIPPEKGTISAPIGRKEGSAILREVNFETGEPARTRFHPSGDAKRAFSGLPETGNRQNPPDPGAYGLHRLSPHRKTTFTTLTIPGSTVRHSTPIGFPFFIP